MLQQPEIPQKTVPELLREAAQTYEQRNKIYGNNYKEFGNVMKAIFPKGLAIITVEEWNRLGIYVQLVSKLTRYAANFEKGGHADSAHDSSVYAAMLEELTKK